MAKYYDPITQQVTEIGNPGLNPDLTAGRTQVPDTTKLGGGYAPPTDLTITSELLVPGTNLPYVNPNQAMYSMPETSATPAPTAPTLSETEQKQSDIVKELLATSGLAGEKAGYQVEQEKQAGIEAMKASEADYTAQLTQLNAEYKNVENRMQLGAEGRGITAGGLAPITTSEQRKLSIQANTVGALLAATQGKITYAQAQVDRAVNAKYAQAEADRKAKLENLEILSKDPTLTVEQKARADAQTAKLKKEQDAADKKKEDSKTIMDWAVKAAQNGATPEQAKAISDIAMSDNPDLAKAISLYSPYAKAKETGGADVAEFKSFFPNVDITSAEGRQQFLNWKAKMAEAGTKPPVSEVRDTTVSQFLESKKGNDGYVSTTDYQTALRKYIAGGGNQTNFIVAFPQQTYLSNNEIQKLPVALRPQMTVSKSDLIPDQISIINDAKAAIDQVKQRYGDWGAIRQQIIEQSKQQYGFDISPYI